MTTAASLPARFGLKLTTKGETIDAQRDIWRVADDGGFDHLWASDHLASPAPDPTLPCLDGWTVLGAMAAVTSRVHVGLNVSGNAYRHPGALAKIATTVDHLSAGRLELGLGAAWNEAEFKMFGLPFLSTPERICALEESVRIVKALWTEDLVTFAGQFYQVDHAIAEPKPIQKPHPPIWIGGSGPKLTLRVVAQLADVWSAHGADKAPIGSSKTLDEHCAAVGRDPASIRRSVMVRFSSPDEALRETETYLRAGFNEILLRIGGGPDTRQQADDAVALLPRLRALAANST